MIANASMRHDVPGVFKLLQASGNLRVGKVARAIATGWIWISVLRAGFKCGHRVI